MCLLVTGWGSGTSPRTCCGLYHMMSSLIDQKKQLGQCDSWFSQKHHSLRERLARYQGKRPDHSQLHTTFHSMLHLDLQWAGRCFEISWIFYLGLPQFFQPEAQAVGWNRCSDVERNRSNWVAAKLSPLDCRWRSGNTGNSKSYAHLEYVIIT